MGGGLALTLTSTLGTITSPLTHVLAGEYRQYTPKGKFDVNASLTSAQQRNENGDRVSVLVNSLGATPVEELYNGATP